MKLISVIIPAYNVAEYISRTINSLLVQMTQEIEVILIDDGSADETAAIVSKAFSETGFRNHLKIIKQENQGLSSARNVGLRAATGKYVYFLDGDDYVSDELFETIQPLLIQGTTDIICWRYDKVNLDGSTFRKYQESLRKASSNTNETSGIEFLEKILVKRSHSIWIGSAVYRRDLLIKKSLVFYPNCQRAEDVEFIHKALLIANKVRFLNKTMSFYVQRPGSIVHSFSIRRFDAIDAVFRTSMYLDQIKPTLDGKLLYILKYRRPIEDYLFLAAFSSIHEGIDNKLLRQMIEDTYPQLQGEIAAISKHLMIFDPFRWIYLMYRFFPRLFVFCVRVFSPYQGF